jgi:transcriptional regulator with XRE-family HTH domain
LTEGFPFVIYWETFKGERKRFKMNDIDIIQKIKALRSEKGFSLNQFSKLTGLSKGYLSKIENAVKFPPLSTLNRIATALGVDLTYFFTQDPVSELDRKIVVVRKEDRKKIGDEQQVSGITRIPLADKKFGRNMEPFIIELPADHQEVYQFAVEEFHLILKGKVELSYGGQRYILEEGDCAYLDGDIPYTGRSLTKKPAQILMIHYDYKKISGDPFTRGVISNNRKKG